jgi:hypothetical protein
MSRAQQAQQQETTYSYANTVPAGYTQTSSYVPVGTTTSNLYSAQPTAYYTSQQYTGPTTTYVQGSQLVGAATSGYANGGATSGYAVSGGNATYAVNGGNAAYAVSGSHAHKAVAEEIPVESRIEYIPFEKKYIEYEQVEKVYQVPVETEVIEYEEVVRNERVPFERTVTDYYAVETQVEYIRREIEETVMVEEPVEKVYERVQYIPVETQIVHYPERDNYVPAKTQVRTEYVGVQQGQGQIVQSGSNAQQSSKVEGTYQTYGGVQSGSRVGQTTYVSGGSGVNVTTSNYTPAYSTGYATTGGQYTTAGGQGYTTTAGGQGYTTTTGGQGYTTAGGQGYTTTGATYTVPAGYTAQQYASSSYQPTTYQTTYTTSNQPAVAYQTTTGGYVTGGSGVRGGYVTGGSGVRTGPTYTSGSNIKQSSYETNAGYY